MACTSRFKMLFWAKRFRPFLYPFFLRCWQATTSDAISGSRSCCHPIAFARSGVPSDQICNAFNDVWADILRSASEICIINLNNQSLYGKRTKAFALTIVSVIKADGGGLGRYMHNGRDKPLAWGSPMYIRVLEWV